MEKESIHNEAPVLQETIIQCIRRNESVVFIESHAQCDSKLLKELAESAGYKVWTVDQSEESKPNIGKGTLDLTAFREPSHKKCFYHLTLRWNNNMADRDYLDTWFIEFLEHSLQQLLLEADSKANGLDIPVNIVVDNMALLQLSVENFDGLITVMQKRQRWKLKIIAQL